MSPTKNTKNIMKKCISFRESGSIKGYCLFAFGDMIPLVGVLLSIAVFVWGHMLQKEDGFTLLNYHNADAKFLGDKIITSVDEEIRILNLEGQELKCLEGVSASWFYVQEDSDKDGCWNIAYSNHKNETHILQISTDLTFIHDWIALKTDTLAIDPILVKVEGGWLLSNTEIEGRINNPDPEEENGLYTVKLYFSEDLKQWNYVNDIVQREKNLEDGDICLKDGRLYYFYEMENYDKGPSAICVTSSNDQGKSWSEPKELLPPVADNEMAECIPTEKGWRLYVSSDYACVGESYQGASVYYADYNKEFEPVSTYQLVTMPDNQGVRLYETREINAKNYFLFARNFLTDCDFLLRVGESEN